MKDPRLITLAKNLVDYSVELKKGELLYLEIKGKAPLELGKEIIKEATQRGAVPFVVYNDASLIRKFLLSATKEQIVELSNLHLEIMKKMDAYIGIKGDDNVFDFADIPKEKMKIYNEEYIGRVHIKERVENTKWCVLRYPTPSMFVLAEKSEEEFEDFFFSVSNLDYKKLSFYMNKLKMLMEKTDKVKIIGKGTDISFSIKGIPVISCDGKFNIPDGEVFTAPVKDSVNGVIEYNTPSIHDSITYNNVRLEFKDGKIISANCDNNEANLEKIFNIDEGARYVGEFAIGVNPFILEPMKDILFDEKIWGSFHLTPGNSYDKAPNGNKSSLHWDLISIQTKEYGGGEIYFDDVLVRKDGDFVHPELIDFKRDVLTLT